MSHFFAVTQCSPSECAGARECVRLESLIYGLLLHWGMSRKNRSLHGSAPDKSAVALLVIDVINDLEFEEGDQLLAHALPMARALAELKRRAKEERVPVVYVNDNFGRVGWLGTCFELRKQCGCVPLPAASDFSASETALVEP